MSLCSTIQGSEEIKGVGWKGNHLCSHFSLEICFFGADGEVKWLFALQIAPRRRKKQLFKDVSEGSYCKLA